MKRLPPFKCPKCGCKEEALAHYDEKNIIRCCPKCGPVIRIEKVDAEEDALDAIERELSSE